MPTTVPRNFFAGEKSSGHLQVKSPEDIPALLCAACAWNGGVRAVAHLKKLVLGQPPIFKVWLRRGKLGRLFCLNNELCFFRGAGSLQELRLIWFCICACAARVHALPVQISVPLNALRDLVSLATSCGVHMVVAEVWLWELWLWSQVWLWEKGGSGSRGWKAIVVEEL